MPSCLNVLTNFYENEYKNFDTFQVFYKEIYSWLSNTNLNNQINTHR